MTLSHVNTSALSATLPQEAPIPGSVLSASSTVVPYEQSKLEEAVRFYHCSHPIISQIHLS